MNIQNRNAFTFVEILVVVLISTVTFAGIHSTFVVGNQAWVHYNTTVIVKSEARRALFGMANELREAQKIKVIQSRDRSAIYFYRPAVGSVSYEWANHGNSANKIIRNNRLNTRVIAQHISLLSFKQTDKTVAVFLTASKQNSPGSTSQISTHTRIALRPKTSMFNH